MMIKEKVSADEDKMDDDVPFDDDDDADDEAMETY